MIFRKVVAAAVATVALAVAGCGSPNTFEQRLESLGKVYRQGQAARAAYLKNGLVINEDACGKAFTETGANADNVTGDRDDKEFQALRQRSFVNGCMDRPNDANLPATTPASTPSPTSSPQGGQR